VGPQEAEGRTATDACVKSLPSLDPVLKDSRINLGFKTIELLAGSVCKGTRLTTGPSQIVYTSTTLKRYALRGGEIDYLLTQPVYKSMVYPLASVLWHFGEVTDRDTDATANAGINISF
jgi:hypothetical protein